MVQCDVVKHHKVKINLHDIELFVIPDAAAVFCSMIKNKLQKMKNECQLMQKSVDMFTGLDGIIMLDFIKPFV